MRLNFAEALLLLSSPSPPHLSPPKKKQQQQINLLLDLCWWARSEKWVANEKRAWSSFFPVVALG